MFPDVVLFSGIYELYFKFSFTVVPFQDYPRPLKTFFCHKYLVSFALFHYRILLQSEKVVELPFHYRTKTGRIYLHKPLVLQKGVPGMNGCGLHRTPYFTIASCHIQIALRIIWAQQKYFLINIVCLFLFALSLVLISKCL